MQGSTHLVIGFMTGVAVAAHFALPPSAPLASVLVVAVAGSLLPDIDHPNSKISRRVAIPLWAVLKHRGLTHSLLALVGLALLLMVFNAEFIHSCAFLAGYASHLLADAVTPQGIELFYPMRRRVRLLPDLLAIETGSIFENVVAIASLFVSIYLVNQL